MLRAIAAGAVLCCVSGFAQPIENPGDGIQPSWIAPHVRFLASANLEGRDTGSRGYDIAANYVAAQFEMLGLKPAGDGGTYFQKLRIRKSSVATASMRVGGRALDFTHEFFIHPSGNEEGLDVSAPLVFVGFGVTAPEQQWDDYAGIDVRNKIAVMLPGTPAAFPRDARALHSVMRRRVDNARAHGAVAVVVLNPEMPAATVQERQMRQLDATMWLDDSGAHSAFFGGSYVIIPKEGIAAVLGGESVDALRKALATGPHSVDLHAGAQVRAQFEKRDSDTANVVASLRGSELPSEYVVYSAHLDHDGMSDYFPGDHVLHGALDNAGGVATILAVARELARSKHPRRSILFLAVTGEEKGVVGSDAFVHHPTVPRDAIVADINCDNFLWYVPVKDISGVGVSQSTLEDAFAAAAAAAHLKVSDVPAVGPNLLVLSDHFSFLNAGIPAVSIFNGEQSGDGTRTSAEIFSDYMKDIHHTPRDSFEQPIDWNAAATEARFVLLLGEQIANGASRPQLKKSSAFAPHDN